MSQPRPGLPRARAPGPPRRQPEQQQRRHHTLDELLDADVHVGETYLKFWQAGPRLTLRLPSDRLDLPSGPTAEALASLASLASLCGFHAVSSATCDPEAGHLTVLMKAHDPARKNPAAAGGPVAHA